MQKFEQVPDERRLTMMLDLLRYENSAQLAQIAVLESEIVELRANLDQAQQTFDDLQRIIDLQNARAYSAGKSSK